MTGPVAFIADIHGNVWALAAVLADIRRRGIKGVFNLGDSVYGPLEPGLTAQLLMSSSIPSLRGNQDRILIEPPPPHPHPTFRYTMSRLRPEQVEWLRDQPCVIEYGDLFLCHGTPTSDEVYLTETVTTTGAKLRSTLEMEQLVERVSQRVILCGHSHLPRIIGLSNGRVIVNPGSVGLPAYADDLPFVHRMESGSTHARYAIIDGDRVEQIAVAYPSGPAAAKARENGRDDWAYALETGFART